MKFELVKETGVAYVTYLKHNSAAFAIGVLCSIYRTERLIVVLGTQWIKNEKDST